MNIEQIQALKAAAECATPGEWCTDDYHGVIADSGLNSNFYIATCSGPEHRQNKRFIAAANPAAILSLLAERDADKALIAELQQDCENDPRIHEIIDLKEQITETNNALCKLLPSVQYMDPPDGGCVTPLEQVVRMVADYRQQITEQEKRIAELREWNAGLAQESLDRQQRISELESQRQMAFMACNRWADKFREAEAKIEARTLTVKLPRDITHVTNKYFEEGRDAVIEAIESQLAAAGITLVVGE